MSNLRGNQEGTFFLTGRVAQAVGDYLARLERYEEAREEYQQANAAYEQILPSSPEFLEAQKNQAIVLRKLKELPAQQKSSEAYRLELLLADDLTPSCPMATIASVNLSQWLHNIFDGGWQAIAELLGQGEANLAYAYALRSKDVESGDLETNDNSTVQSSGETFGAIIAQLSGKGREIPPIARGAYRDFQLTENSLRLYAFTWVNPTQSDRPEWTLLLILGAQSGNDLPQGLKLQVSDLTNSLVEQEVEPNAEQTYLYARVVGTGNEQFLVTIVSNEGKVLILPPFSFIPE
jgi:tetratricopeptide (TPR) repeat protein